MKPFLLSLVITGLLIPTIIITKPHQYFYHGMECTGGIGGGCDRSTARGVWKWMSK
jgi:hypothetical protein